MGGFFTWAVAEDDKNSTRHVIQVNQFTYRLEDFHILVNNYRS